MLKTTLNANKLYCLFISGWWGGYYTSSQLPATLARCGTQTVQVFESLGDTACVEKRTYTKPEQVLKNGFREIK